jgi:hypothetical protein
MMLKSRIGLFAGAALGVIACAAVAQQPGQDSLAPVSVYQQANWDRFGQFGSESAKLVQQYIKAKAEDKAELRKKLSDALGKQFDANAQQQQKELDELEKEIANLRALLKKRLDAKSTIVERRLEQLVQDAEGLGWTAPGAGRNPFGSYSGTRPALPALPAPKSPDSTR